MFMVYLLLYDDELMAYKSFSGQSSTFGESPEPESCVVDIDDELELSPLEYGLIDTETLEFVSSAMYSASI